MKNIQLSPNRILSHFLIMLTLVFLSCNSDESETNSSSTTIKISISTLRLDWGTINYGQGSDKIFTFTNDASSGEILKGSAAITGNAFYIVNGGGAYTLAPGGSRTVKVRFLPQARGTFSGSLNINHNAGNKSSPTSIALAGVVH